MWQTLLQLLTPTFSFISVCIGSALLTTIVPIRLQMVNVPELTIGIISSAFYAGMILGSFKIERIVSRIGHIRGYAAFAAMLALITLVQGMYFQAIAWFFLRLITGYCMAGIFIVIESWFLASGSKEYRGRLLALYMTTMYAAQAGGQFLLYVGDIRSLELFCLIAILFCLSIVPLALTRMQSPYVHEPSALKLRELYKISPTGMMGAFSAGIILGSLYSLLPLYTLEVGYKVSDIGTTMGLLILGGMTLQYPMGKISDLFDRRKMLIILSASIGIGSIFMLLFSYIYTKLFFIGCTLFGGIVFILYPLSISHTCDHVDHKDVVAATQGQLLSYGLGATIGPILSSSFMQISHMGLFVFISILSGLLGIFIHKRGFVRSDLPLEEQHNFAISSSTTPVASNMDPRANEDED